MFANTRVFIVVFALGALTVSADPSVDSISNASMFFYEESSMDIHEIRELMDTYGKGPLVAITLATVNADDSPNVMTCIPVFLDDETIALGLSPNNTGANLEERKIGVFSIIRLVPEADPASEGYKYEKQLGARIIVRFREKNSDGHILLDVVKILPLG